MLNLAWETKTGKKVEVEVDFFIRRGCVDAEDDIRKLVVDGIKIPPAGKRADTKEEYWHAKFESLPAGKGLNVKSETAKALCRALKVSKIREQIMLTTPDNIYDQVMAEREKVSTAAKERKEKEASLTDASLTDNTTITGRYGYVYMGFVWSMQLEDGRESDVVKGFELALNQAEKIKLNPEAVMQSFVSKVSFGEYSNTTYYRLTIADMKKVVEQLNQMTAAKEEQRKKKEAEKKAEIADLMENELFIFGDELLSSVGNRLLHSLGAKISQKDNRITIYTTTYSRMIPDAVGTYDIKDDLKNAGFKWDGQEKEWYSEYSVEMVDKTIELLKTHDTKTDPHALGLARCWECGRWCKPSELDESGYCGC